MKKTLTLILVIILALTIFGCTSEVSPCQDHTDKNNDQKCDECGEALENSDTPPSATALISNGQVNFQFVRAGEVDSAIMTIINPLCDKIAALGGSVEIVNDRSNNQKDVEVLIGDVKTRGKEYLYDKYSLGEEGYVIKLVGNKILVNGGSPNSLVDALELFVNDILGITDDTEALPNVYMTSDMNIEKIQDDYRITSIKINGEEINGYTIACVTFNTIHYEAALELNSFLYSKAGYYLPLVDISNANKSIVIEAVDDAGPDGFRVRTDENNALRIECAYANAFSDAFANFLNNEFRLKEGEIHFDSSYEYTDEVSVVYYEDFGAKGDGYTDDYAAIKAAHEYANQCGQTVKATKNKTYLIKDIVNEYGSAESITIKTNVDWGNAKIIIDDTHIFDKSDKNNKNIFVVKSDYSVINWTKSQIEENFPDGVDADEVTKINWDYNFPALLIFTNKDHKNYIRYGGDANDGAAQKELIVVDKDGNIDPTTRFLLDYEKVTSVAIHRTDVTPITIEGGIITTRASRNCPKDASGNFQKVYYSRGIQVTRSNTTLKNIKHYITGEVENAPNDKTNKGPSYSGFFTASTASNVYIVDCVLTAHRYYKLCGTYDFNANTTNNIYLKNCTQSNFYLTDENGELTDQPSMTGSMYWGVGGTNYCKNMVYDGCELTRYDAHSGVYNGKIINSKVTAINLIGGGDMLIENCIIEPTGTDIVNLRSDYGATWNGTVTLRNCSIKNPKTTVNLFNMQWVNHDFGYIVHMPNVIIDNLSFQNKVTKIDIFKRAKNSGYQTAYTEQNINTDTLSDKTANVNIVATPKFIKVLNTNGYTYTLYNSSFFKDTSVSENIVRG